MRALSLMACAAARTQSLATTVYPVLLASQDPNRMVKVLSRLLLKNRCVSVVIHTTVKTRMFSELRLLWICRRSNY